MLMVTDMAMFD